MSYLKTLSVAVCTAAMMASTAFAADRPFSLGSVWTVTLVRVKPGMDVTYLRDLATNWKRVMDEARDQQLIISYKILDGNLPGKDEWNMMLLVEQKNWGAFDGADGKFDAVMSGSAESITMQSNSADLIASIASSPRLSVVVWTSSFEIKPSMLFRIVSCSSTTSRFLTRLSIDFLILANASE